MQQFIYKNKPYKIIVNLMDGCFGTDCGMDIWLESTIDDECLYMNDLEPKVREQLINLVKSGLI